MLFVESILSLGGRGFVEWRDVWLLEDRSSLTQDFLGRQEFAVGSCLLKRVPGGLHWSMQRAVQLLICVKNDVCVCY